METAVCWGCVEDEFLKEIIRDKGHHRLCSACKKKHRTFTMDELGGELAPIIREHFVQGEQVMSMGPGDDDHSWEQEGDPLSDIVQEVLGQYFDFNDEIVAGVVDSEYVDERDGGIAFFDDTANYVERSASPHRYFEEWNHALDELKHQRRFFGAFAGTLFDTLFRGIEKMQTWNQKKGKAESVVIELDEGVELFRARICESTALLKDAMTDPFKHVGPPPPERARAGRMNVEGVAVFYGATDLDTCLAEMRPYLGGDSAVITVRTTRSLRLLDFTRIDRSYRPLSYFQPDFTEEAEKNAFLRRLGGLISKPVAPGRESDYLITQTMAEYLAYAHEKPLNGILFKSVQKDGGTNIVLFPTRNAFPITYVEKSFKLFSTKSIKYKHQEKKVHLVKGEIEFAYDLFDD